MQHTRGSPWHPQTRGRIEYRHQALKYRLLLESHCLPGDRERGIEALVAHYCHRRYHERLGKLTPAEVYCGRGNPVMLEKKRIMGETLKRRRLLHRGQAA